MILYYPLMYKELYGTYSKLFKEDFVEQKTKTKISDIDFETEDLATLMKIQTRLVRAINAKMKN